MPRYHKYLYPIASMAGMKSQLASKLRRLSDSLVGSPSVIHGTVLATQSDHRAVNIS